MKKPSSDIFNLIKSMTKTEKRYFSKWADLHVIGQQNNYYTLFKCIDNQSVYDENIVKKEMEAHGVTIHFTALKFQLIERVLEALHQFYQKSSIAETVKRELHFCKILIDKNQLDMASKRLDKAKKTIDTYQLLEFLPEYFHVKRQVLAKQFYKKISFEELEDLYEDINKMCQNLQNGNEYERLNTVIQKQQYEKIRLALADFQNFKENKWLSDEEEPTSFRSKMLRLNALATLHFMKGETGTAYEYNQAFVKLLESLPKMMELYGSRYVLTLSNLLIDSFILGKFEVLKKDIQKLQEITTNRTFQKQVPNLEIKVFRQTYLLNLNWAIADKDFKRGIDFAPAIETGLKKHQKTIGTYNEVTFYYLLAYCYFGNGQFSEALTFLNKILDNRIKQVTELIEFAHLLNLLTHFELGNDDLLEYLLPSTRRFLRKRRPLYQTEELVLAHLKKVIYTPDTTEKEQLWAAFYTQITILKKAPEEQRVFNYFDFAWWRKQ
jgi:tetratricopeptide (TPR) repeat protein